MDEIESYVKIAIIVLIPIGLTLDILALRWKKIANFIVYQEAVSTIAQAFVPHDYGNFDLLIILQTYIMVYLVSICKVGQSVIACVVSFALYVYVVYPLMYNLEAGHWSFGRQFAVLSQLLTCAAFFTAFSMVITYIVTMRGRMNYLFFENSNLLNKMNEGLVVIDENDRSVKFANVPAVKLIKEHAFEQDA